MLLCIDVQCSFSTVSTMTIHDTRMRHCAVSSIHIIAQLTVVTLHVPAPAGLQRLPSAAFAELEGPAALGRRRRRRETPWLKPPGWHRRNATLMAIFIM
jgi:hypothetical protein